MLGALWAPISMICISIKPSWKTHRHENKRSAGSKNRVRALFDGNFLEVSWSNQPVAIDFPVGTPFGPSKLAKKQTPRISFRSDLFVNIVVVVFVCRIAFLRLRKGGEVKHPKKAPSLQRGGTVSLDYFGCWVSTPILTCAARICKHFEINTSRWMAGWLDGNGEHHWRLISIHGKDGASEKWRWA